MKKQFVAVVLSLSLVGATFPASAAAQDWGQGKFEGRIKHVLLVSIDGMHALDYINCSRGVSGVNGGQPYCPHLADLGQNATNYLQTSTSRPSDSFPGLMAIVTGGTPRLFGAFYDVA